MEAVLPKWLLVFGWESISVISLCSSDSVCLGDDDAVVASGGGAASAATVEMVRRQV